MTDEVPRWKVNIILAAIGDPRGMRVAIDRAVADHHAQEAKSAKRRARTIPAKLRQEVMPPGSTCVYCGDAASHIDHVIPVSKGGTSARENLAPACRRCNMEKLGDTPEEWRAWREEQGEPWPPEPFAVVVNRYIAEHPNLLDSGGKAALR